MDRAKRDYQKFYKIFLILFLLSFSLNLFMLSLYLKERKEIPTPPPKEVKEIQEVKVKEVFEEKKPFLEKIPFPLVYMKDKEYSLLCDKQNRSLSLFRSEKNIFSLIKSYPCIVGSNNIDKREAGDLATPEGIYFLTSFLSGKQLPQKYGIGAFSLNYPNFLDQREGKKGSGIWLHGYPDHLERPPFSEGCVVVKDEYLKELMGLVKVGDTPLVIVDSLQYKPLEDQQNVLKILSQFLKDWEMAWESRDTAKYLLHYSREFISSDGKNYQKFKEYKYRVNQSKKFIQLQIDSKAFLLSQKNEGKVAVVRINQDYRSDNFKSYSRKILYLKENQKKWEIIGEVTL